jgi:hypothetical protein
LEACDFHLFLHKALQTEASKVTAGIRLSFIVFITPPSF